MKGSKLRLRCQPRVLINAASLGLLVLLRCLPASATSCTCPGPMPTKAISGGGEAPFENDRMTISTCRHLKAVQQRRCPGGKLPERPCGTPRWGALHVQDTGRKEPVWSSPAESAGGNNGLPRLRWKQAFLFGCVLFAHNRNSSHLAPKQRVGPGGVLTASMSLAYRGHLRPRISTGDFTSPCLGQNLSTQRLPLSTKDLFPAVSAFRDEEKDSP